MGFSQELCDKLNEIKRNVLRRFKHQRFVELNEELKSINKKNKSTLMLRMDAFRKQTFMNFCELIWIKLNSDCLI